MSGILNYFQGAILRKLKKSSVIDLIDFYTVLIVSICIGCPTNRSSFCILGTVNHITLGNIPKRKCWKFFDKNQTESNYAKHIENQILFNINFEILHSAYKSEKINILESLEMNETKKCGLLLNEHHY